MKKEELINILEKTGSCLLQHANNIQNNEEDLKQVNALFYDRLESAVKNEYAYNGWFTEVNIRKAMGAIAKSLKKDSLTRWLDKYPKLPVIPEHSKTIGIVMAGNIPLVGFHDLISVLVSGHRILAKPSSKDERLIKIIAEMMIFIEPALKDRISFTEQYLKNTDAIIATGSNNTGRYFEYYFRNTPHIIRKNRNGVAVLHGNETKEDLHQLGKDIFSYFGLGCRNVTKLYLPESFPPERILEQLESFISITEHNKYCNNLDYNRTLYLMNKDPFLDNGVVLFRESENISSPVGVVYYEKYDDFETIKEKLTLQKNQIQCIVEKEQRIPGSIRPGETQYPELWDYADGVDTLKFLQGLTT